MKLKALAAATALLAVAGAVQAGDVQPVDAAQALRAVRDKDTGQLRRATPEQASQPQRPLVVRQYSNGMRSARLSPEYLSSLQATRQPDGSLKVTHGEADEHAAPAPQSLPTK